MNYRCLISAPPATEPVTLSEIKSHLRVDNTLDDTMLESMISEARQAIEKRTNRAFFTQTRKLYFEYFNLHDDKILLPGTPVSSITSVEYVDQDGVTQTWTASEYNLKEGEPNYLQLAYDEIFPVTRSRRDDVVITYVCGVADVADIDPLVKAAIKLYVELGFDREENTDKTSTRISQAYENIITQLMVGDEFLYYG